MVKSFFPRCSNFKKFTPFRLRLIFISTLHILCELFNVFLFLVLLLLHKPSLSLLQSKQCRSGGGSWRGSAELPLGVVQPRWPPLLPPNFINRIAFYTNRLSNFLSIKCIDSLNKSRQIESFSIAVW